MIHLYLMVAFLQIVLLLFMQWQVYLRKIVLTFAFSSVSLALFLFIEGAYINSLDIIVLSFLTLFVRGIFIPWYILKKSLHGYIQKEPKHIVPTASSIIISLALVVVAYVVYRFTLYNYVELKGGSLPIALLLQGIFLVISRNNAFVQLIGYMVMENSIFLFAGFLFPQLPFIVEGGILLDLIGVVMISAIIMRLREEVLANVVNEFEEFRG